MNIKYALENLKPYERNHKWLVSENVSVSLKSNYYLSMFVSGLKMLFSNNKSINYLGKQLYFDNPATIMNLQTYPYEINNIILRYMDIKPKSVLDVGANIGQFARTLSYALTKCKIYCIEPNPEVFSLLSRNKLANMKTYNIGVSDVEGELDFYFEPNRSAIGSMLVDNAGEETKLEKIKVKVTNKVGSLIKKSIFDLIKIDVEGYEIEAVRGLAGLSCKYMFIEISSINRARNYSDIELYQEIKKYFGEFDIVYSTGLESSDTTYEILIRFRINTIGA